MYPAEVAFAPERYREDRISVSGSVFLPIAIGRIAFEYPAPYFNG